MILHKHDTGSYRTTTWSWWSSLDGHGIRFSPNFHSERDAMEWHEMVVKSVLEENQPVAVGKQCTCEDCACNAGPEKLHADGEDRGR